MLYQQIISGGDPCLVPKVGQHNFFSKACTGFSSEIGTKLRDWAVGQAGGSCYSWAALSSNDSKTLYTIATFRDQVA